MKSILDAQLTAISRGEAPTVGNNTFADSTLQGGDTF